MSEFKFTTKTLDSSEKAIDDLTEKWKVLDGSFNELIQNKETLTDGDDRNEFIKEPSIDFFNEYYKSLAKVEASEEVKNNTDKIYDTALMRPVHLSVGVILLSVLIYELYTN